MVGVQTPANLDCCCRTRLGWPVPSGSGANQTSETLGVVQRLGVDGPAVEQRKRRAPGVLLLEDLVDLTDPALVPSLSDSGGVLRTGQTDAAAELQQNVGREAAAVLGRLLGEQLATQLIESADSGSSGQSICRTDRLLSEKGPDSILHGHRAGRDLSTQQVSGHILELTAVGALRILEDDQAGPSTFAAHDHAPFRGMTRRGFSGFHDSHSARSPRASHDTLCPYRTSESLGPGVRGNWRTLGGLMAERVGGKRTVIWALVIGALGVVVAIVALVIAISANSTTNDNAKITKAVRVEEGRQIGGVRADLQRNVAAATAVLKRLQHSSSRAHRADAALRRDVNTAKNGVLRNGARISANRETIASLQTSVVHVQANVANLQTTVGSLSTAVKNLTTSSTSQAQQQRVLSRRLNALQKTVNALP
jgi:uncharacterized protein YlxW (UPF0749 family)